MTQNIISEWADIKDTEAMLATDEKLNKFAHDFCSKFGVFVSAVNKNLEVVNKNGLYGGSISHRWGYVKGNRQLIYVYSARHITKNRSSANSNHYERDSLKINTLLKSIEKNNEEPSTENLYKELDSGVYSAFQSLNERLDRHSYIDADLALAVFYRYSKMLNGEDAPLLPHEKLKRMNEELEKFKNNLGLEQENNKRMERFSKGCTVVGSVRSGGAVPYYYYVGTAKKDRDTIKVDDLIRHNSLRDIPHLAGLCAMLREYFKAPVAGSSGHYDARNELGFDLHDEYHADMDVACGYNRGGVGAVGWILIPNEPPVSV